MDVSDFDPQHHPSDVDVVIIGGGAAGLAAGLQLARQERSVLVLDAGEPRNAPAAHLHGYLGLDGLAPLELLARGRGEVRGYGGIVARGTVVGSSVSGDAETRRFTLTLASGAQVSARALVLAAGVADVLPQVPGLAQRWGIDVLHCPYCHGWEVRGQRIGILASTPNAVHQALLFGRLGRDSVLITHGARPGEDDIALLAAAGVRLVEGPVAEVLADGGALRGVRLEGGDVVELDALAVQTRFEARLGGLDGVGLAAVEHASGMGTWIEAGFAGQTGVPGVWVAGNAAEPMAQLGAAAAGGAMAGAGVNAALAMEDARAALVAGVS